MCAGNRLSSVRVIVHRYYVTSSGARRARVGRGVGRREGARAPAARCEATRALLAAAIARPRTGSATRAPRDVLSVTEHPPHGVPAPAARSAPRPAGAAPAAAAAGAPAPSALAAPAPARTRPGRRPLEPVPHLEAARFRQWSVSRYGRGNGAHFLSAGLGRKEKARDRSPRSDLFDSSKFLCFRVSALTSNFLIFLPFVLNYYLSRYDYDFHRTRMSRFNTNTVTFETLVKFEHKLSRSSDSFKRVCERKSKGGLCK